MQNSDEQLKKALCKELNCLRYHGSFPTVWLDQNKQWNGRVTNREWSWIMSEVEKKLSTSGSVEFQGSRYGSQTSLFVCLLAALVSGEKLGEWQMPAFGMGCELIFKIATAPWQTRAVAYFAVIGKSI
jgi:hypothetical protein